MSHYSTAGEGDSGATACSWELWEICHNEGFSSSCSSSTVISGSVTIHKNQNLTTMKWLIFSL